ncbi:MAG: hypothetical protein V1725_05730 [archaeon]
MFFFKKKKAPEEAATEEVPAAEGEQKSSGVSGSVEVELTKIKSQLEAMNEVRRSNSERFSRISEQIGELRGMIVDTNKTMTSVEISATKAIDLVNAVHPDQLMVEVRKSEGKVEALKASIEANEAIMQDIMKEMKEMRRLMNFYKGTDQVVKLNDDVKKELFDIKKTEAIVSSHADRVDTIFLEVEKKFTEFNKFNDTVKDLGRQMEKLNGDFDKIRVSTDQKEDKKEFVGLLTKFNNFEKHTTNILKLLDVRGKAIETELRENFRRLAIEASTKLNVDLDPEKIQSATQKELGTAPAPAPSDEQKEQPAPEKKPSKLNIKSLFGKKDETKPEEQKSQ